MFEFDFSTQKTPVIQGGGKTPFWNSNHLLQVEDIHQSLVIRVMDEDIGGDDLIGICPLKISSLLVGAEKEEGLTDWYSIYNKNDRVGLLRLSSKFKHDGVPQVVITLEQKYADEQQKVKDNEIKLQ